MTRSGDASSIDWSALQGAQDRSVKEALGALIPGGRSAEQEREALAAFAASNGLTYTRRIKHTARDLPSSVLTTACESVLASPGPPYVEIGNHGMRFWPGGEEPDRRGYVAIQHGADLPLIVTRRARPAKPGIFDRAIAGAGAVMDVVAFFDPDVPVDSTEPARGPSARRVDLPRGCPMSALVREDRFAEGSRLVTGALPQLVDLQAHANLEIRDGWFFAYTLDGELSTLDPARWAWAFTLASRMLDVLALWDVDVLPDRSATPFRPVVPPPPPPPPPSAGEVIKDRLRGAVVSRLRNQD